MKDLNTPTTLASLAPAKWVRPNLLPVLFGINPDQARKYRERGIWLEERHWRYDPLHRVVYSPKAIEAWFGGEV